MKVFLKIIGVLIFLFMIFTIVYSIADYSGLKAFVSNSVASHGMPAIFGMALFLDLFPQYLSAHMIILIAALLKMNIFMVTVVVLIGTFIASILGFWLGKNLEENLLRELFHKKMYDQIKKGMRKYGKWYVALAAVSPLPYIPIIFGALDMEWKEFWIYGIAVRLMGFILTGIFAVYFLDALVKYAGLA